MIFLFTTNQKIGAKAIRWGLDTDVSHFAVLFLSNLKEHGIVIESRLGYRVKPRWFSDFAAENRIVSALRPKGLTAQGSILLYQDILDRVGGQGYDWKGVGFLTVAVLIYRKLLNKPLPKDNKWGDKELQYCSEVMWSIKDFLTDRGVNMEKYDSQMLLPNRAREILLESDNMEVMTQTVKRWVGQ